MKKLNLLALLVFMVLVVASCAKSDSSKDDGNDRDDDADKRTTTVEDYDDDIYTDDNDYDDDSYYDDSDYEEPSIVGYWQNYDDEAMCMHFTDDGEFYQANCTTYTDQNGNEVRKYYYWTIFDYKVQGDLLTVQRDGYEMTAKIVVTDDELLITRNNKTIPSRRISEAQFERCTRDFHYELPQELPVDK